MNRILRSSIKVILIGAAVLALILAFALIPIPGYLAGSEGEVTSAKEFIKVENETESKGDYYITSYLMTEATLMDYLGSKLGLAELEPLPPISEQKIIEAEIDQDKEDLENSKLNAMAAAFQKAGKPYDYEHKGWEILENDEEIGLKKGDLLVEVEGISLKQSDEFFYDELEKVFQKKEIGDLVHYKVLRGEKIVDVKSKVIEEEGEKVDEIGFYSIKKQRVSFNSPVKVDFREIEDTGGPSAGLMMSLAILDKLLPEDLTKGYKIAGTGTISADGRVGMISGENFKVMGADTGGAKIFFCPEGNAALARKTVEEFGLNIEVVPVATLDEEVEYLRKMK